MFIAMTLILRMGREGGGGRGGGWGVSLPLFPKDQKKTVVSRFTLEDKKRSIDLQSPHA